MTVWFSLHLQPWLGEVLVVIGPLTVWALWKFLQSWLGWGGLGDPVEKGIRKLLVKPAATESLIVTLGMMSLLLLTTSSIYVEYEGAGDGESDFKVTVLVDGNPFLDAPLQVTSARRIAGRPFFGRIFSEDLRLVADSPLYEPLDVRFRPWQPLRLTVPQEFKKKSFHLLLLVPGIRLLSALPESGQMQARRFYLRIGTGGAENIQINDLNQETVYTGAPEVDLKRLATSQPSELVHARLESYLVEAGVPVGARESFHNVWSRKRLVSIPTLKEGGKLKILLGCQGKKPFYEEDIHVNFQGVTVHVIEVDKIEC